MTTAPHLVTAMAIASCLITPFTSRADTAKAPDESVLGTIIVDGSADTQVPPPKLAVMPFSSTDTVDVTSRSVVKRDLDLVGLYTVVEESAMPAGPFAHDTEVDPKVWQAKGIAYLVRVYATGGPAKFSVVGEAWVLSKGKDALFSEKMDATTTDVRLVGHKMTDAILGAITGRKGGFASRMAFSGKTGKGRQIFTIDADGQSPTAVSPAPTVTGDAALAPAFGPDNEIYYALSKSYGPFQLVRSESAKAVDVGLPGSVLGIGFSPDRSKVALAVMTDASSKIYVGKSVAGATPISGLTAQKTEPFANHPVLGPLGKMAYVGGKDVPRVYVDGSAVSPAGFHASSPVFCDAPQGLLVIFTVTVGNGADLIATDTSGGNLRRLTQGQGQNAFPACSPDGRMVGFFSTGKSAKGPGLYVLPIGAPHRLQRIATETGESLTWVR